MGSDGRKNPGKSLMIDLSSPQIKFIRNRVLIFCAISAALVSIPHFMPDNYWLRIYSLAGIYVVLALGLNVVAGFAGLLDLSYVAFFGIGGYIFAFLSSSQFDIHLPFLLVFPVAAIITMGFGFLLGSTTVRLKGDYLAIVTLAFAQIFNLLLLNLDRPVNITGGVNGIYNFDPITLLGFRVTSPVAYSYLIWFLAAIVTIVSFRLKKSRYGRGWEAIREDELAAGIIGVNTTWMKLMAFATGALIAGGTGALFASFQDSVFPNNFGFSQLVVIYCMVILGGLGNILGVVIGAVLLSILPEFLREYGAYRMIFYGLTLILLMALRPEGIMGGIGFLIKNKIRPDKDKSGKLRSSKDLYYTGTNVDTSICRDQKHGPQNHCTALELKGITRSFGGITAINDLNIKLKEKEILSIIGPNGAGKSTVFNLISGIYPPDSGKIVLGDKEITGMKPYKIARAGIARTFQSLRLFENMSVLDNAKVGQFGKTRTGLPSILLHLPLFKKEEVETQKKAMNILGLFGARLTGYRFDQKVKHLSYANRRRVEIARALAMEPKILLLDEPSAGMNPQETIEISDFIKSLRDKYGHTILLIEHKLNLVKNISDRVIALDYGEKIAEGTYDEVAKNEQVIVAYLGRKRT
jgi:branched-chain amino acid transport system permease protein